MADSSVFCSKCGAETFATAHFCMVCGSPLKAAAVAAEVPEQDGTIARAQAPDLEDIDQSFNALIGQAEDAAKTPPNPVEQREPLLRLALEHFRPIREFMIELEIGDIWPERIPACRSAILSLESSATSLGLDAELSPSIRELAGAFQRISALPAGVRSTEEHAILRRASESLIERLRAELGVPGRQATPSAEPASEWLREQEGKREHEMDNEDRPKEKRTIVEEGSRLRGTLSSSCPVDVRGRVDGEIETPSLTVSASGAVHGRAKVGSVRSDGELAGEFDADSIELAGVIKDNTVIRAHTMTVKLSSERGKLQVIFGECEPTQSATQGEASREQERADVLDHHGTDVSAEGGGAVEAPTDAAVQAELHSEHAVAAAADDVDNRKTNHLRSRSQRHSDPPPAVG